MQGIRGSDGLNVIPENLCFRQEPEGTARLSGAESIESNQCLAKRPVAAVSENVAGAGFSSTLTC